MEIWKRISLPHLSFTQWAIKLPTELNSAFSGIELALCVVHINTRLQISRLETDMISSGRFIKFPPGRHGELPPLVRYPPPTLSWRLHFDGRLGQGWRESSKSRKWTRQWFLFYHQRTCCSHDNRFLCLSIFAQLIPGYNSHNATSRMGREGKMATDSIQKQIGIRTVDVM